MRSTFKVLFYLKRDKKKTNGNVPIFCRITVDGKEVRFWMKKDIHPNHWNVKTGKVTGRTSEAVEINTLIDDAKSAIYQVYRDMQEKGNNVTAEKVKNVFLGIDCKQPENLLELFDQHNSEQKLLVGKSVSASMYDKYRITKNHLADFIKKQYDVSDISLKAIDHQFICDFEIFMLTSRGCAENTTAKYLQIFKHVIIVSMKYGRIYKNPFAEYSIHVKKTDRGYLTQDEIEILMEQKFDTKQLERVRDIFVFCCFTGLSYIDVKNLTADHIRTSFDGNLWIMGKRGKTDENFNIPLLEIPKTILEKYRDTLPGNNLLPVISNNVTNGYLKKIGELCGIKKKLTFHLSRHSFATLTLSKGVSLESVSKMLGHTNIQSTLIYARITGEKISNDMALFAEKINGMETKLAVNI
jgi:site-specific recombinase XerD